MKSIKQILGFKTEEEKEEEAERKSLEFMKKVAKTESINDGKNKMPLS